MSRHLIVVPASGIAHLKKVLENWIREFLRFASILDVYAYYGTADERFDQRMSIKRGIGFEIMA